MATDLPFFSEGIEVLRGVHLKGTQAVGTVNLSGALIGGNLDLSQSHITSGDAYALNCQGVKVSDSMYLRALVVRGGVSLAGAKILGQLEFDHANLAKARTEKDNGKEHQILHHNDLVLNAQSLKSALLIWRKVVDNKGAINLNGAKVGILIDDTYSWELVEHLSLNGFRYESIAAPATVRMRMDWLSKDAATAGEFRPQPYEQLARAYKSMGHQADRRAVLVEKEHLQRADERKRLRGVSGSVLRLLQWGLDSLSWLVVGYGYRPFRVLAALVLLLGIGWGMAYQAWHAGDFAPNSDVILSTPEWQRLAEDAAVPNPAEVWSDAANTGRDWETFQSLAYAFDIVVPIVTIGQTEAWAPSTTRGPWGWHLWWARWVLTVLGWIVTAVGAAAITGIIRRE